MRMYDLIEKKKRGEALSEEEIREMITLYTRGDIPDYQMSALMMAIYFRGMNAEETSILTDAMANSGDVVDLSDLGDKTVDKHSTGGVGDKTTLIVTPIVAAAGGTVAKMSGRGLGHTGGTVDKLESFPGFDYCKFILETGRTHQIRVHCAHLGHPVAGDPVYGNPKSVQGLEGQCLHAAFIGFDHPVTGKYMEFSAPLPDYFINVLNRINK